MISNCVVRAWLITHWGMGGPRTSTSSSPSSVTNMSYSSSSVSHVSTWAMRSTWSTDRRGEPDGVDSASSPEDEVVLKHTTLSHVEMVIEDMMVNGSLLRSDPFLWLSEVSVRILSRCASWVVRHVEALWSCMVKVRTSGEMIESTMGSTVSEVW